MANRAQDKHPRERVIDEAFVRTFTNNAHVSIELADDSWESGAVNRGDLDAIALRHAHHDEHLHCKLQPEDGLSRILFDAFEQARYEAIGCNDYAGVQLNLDARRLFDTQIQSGATPNNTRVPETSSIGRLVQAAQLMSAIAFRRWPGMASRGAMENTTEYAALWAVFGRRMDELSTSLQDQHSFGLMIAELLKRWQQAGSMVSDSSDVLDGTLEGQEPDVESSNDYSDDASMDEQSIEPIEATANDDEQWIEEGEQAEKDMAQSDTLAEQLMDEAPVAGADPTIIENAESGLYLAYTTQFDEVCHASDLAESEALRQWRLQLDEYIEVHARLVRRLASRLQRALLARQRRHWQFDMEEGQLDPARLSRLVTDPLAPLSFKIETEAPVRDTTISLLIDNSRSMLGRPIMIAAAVTDILARTLERCGVNVEILGFTTVHLHGGRSTELWEANGKPDDPGRLNDLRHIVYKSADTPYRNSRRQLGLMLDRDILKQNIDGEALLWAHKRLLKRPEQRRILMVISDGAPVDTSTLSANAGDYLAKHLSRVVSDIERAGQVEMLAIGIGHDVSRFYSHALSVMDARQLGPVMLNELENLFRKQNASRF